MNLIKSSSSLILFVALQTLAVHCSLAAQSDSANTEVSLDLAISVHQQQLDSLEAFVPESVSLHLEIAGLQQTHGQFEDAARSLDLALQATRINDGLYATSQLAIIERLIDNASLAGEWRALDAHFYLAMDIAEHSLSVDDPHYQQLVRKFASWKMQAQRNNLDINDEPLSAQDAVIYLQGLLDNLDEAEPDYLARRIQTTNELAMARYYAAMAISKVPVDEFESIGPETVTGQSCFTITEDTGSGPKPVRVCESKQMPNPLFFESRQKAKFEALEAHISWIRGSYLELIEELETDPNSDPVQLAQLMLSLGDMNFLLNDSLRAQTQYARAFEVLTSNGVAQEVQMQLMGQPREISRTALADMGLPLIAVHEQPSGIVSFEVTAEGTIRNLGITGSGADLEEANQQLITTLLRQSVYRPKLEAGQAVQARLEIPAARL
jgi:hypothetical protein